MTKTADQVRQEMNRHPVPQFGQRHRMALALEWSGKGVIQIAREMNVSRTTISNWINGRTEPRYNDLRVWSMLTNVPIEWLETGEVIPPADLTVVEGDAPAKPKKGTRKQARRSSPWIADRQLRDADVIALRRAN